MTSVTSPRVGGVGGGAAQGGILRDAVERDLHAATCAAVLHRVLDQIQQHLRDLVGIGGQDCRGVGAGQDKRDTKGFGHRAVGRHG